MKLFYKIDHPRDSIMKNLPFVLSEAVLISFERSFKHFEFNDGFIVWVYILIADELLGYQLHPATIHTFRKRFFSKRWKPPSQGGTSGQGGIEVLFTPVDVQMEQQDDVTRTAYSMFSYRVAI